jgi:hypothetical protein
VGGEVVHDEDDLVRVGVVDGQEMFDAAGPVDAGPGGLGVGAAPTPQGSAHTKIEQVPQRRYSESSRATRPGAAGVPALASASSCSGFSSITTTGKPGW